MDYILPKTAFHSTYFIKRMYDIFKTLLPHELMDHETSSYCVRCHCFVVFQKILFADSILKLWEEKVC